MALEIYVEAPEGLSAIEKWIKRFRQMGFTVLNWSCKQLEPSQDVYLVFTLQENDPPVKD